MLQAAKPRELAIYAWVVGVALWKMAWGGYRYSLNFERGGQWAGYAPGLRPGWLWGRSVDLSDVQWRDFRAGMPALAAALALFSGASRLLRLLFPSHGGSGWGSSGTLSKGDTGNQGEGAEDAGVAKAARSRAALYLVCAAAFLGYLHGACAVFPVALAISSYLLARTAAGQRHGMTFKPLPLNAAGRRAAAIWAFSVGMLLAARVLEGFRFGSISPALAALDSHRGVTRWEICYNLSLLRVLSFSLDLHWRAQRARHAQRARDAQHAQHEQSACPGQERGFDEGQQDRDSLTAPQKQQQQQQQGQEGHPEQSQQQLGGCSRAAQQAQQVQQAQLDSPAAPWCPWRPADEAAARRRQATALPSVGEYGLLPFLAYVFYPPLYLAGPIMTFQDFAWQLRQPVELDKGQVARYAARFAADWACLELLTHTLYFNSLAKHRVGVQYGAQGLRYGPWEIALTGFWVLCFMWLKFATIWRFFRLAALLEGTQPPDNMRRCFANNYDLQGFWKGWHSSYNAWLVRYMYVPLGGTRWRALNIWPIFLFVAVWHDLEWRLLAWAWLICLAFLPELLVKRAAASPRLAPWRPTACFRHAAAALAALNISALMAANLAGFAVGPAGLRELAPQLLREPRLAAAALATFFSAAQLMFWVRGRRAQQGDEAAAREAARD